MALNRNGRQSIGYDKRGINRLTMVDRPPEQLPRSGVEPAPQIGALQIPDVIALRHFELQPSESRPGPASRPWRRA